MAGLALFLVDLEPLARAAAALEGRRRSADADVQARDFSALTATPNAGGLPGAGCRLAQAASAAAQIAMTTVRSDVDIFHAPVAPTDQLTMELL